MRQGVERDVLALREELKTVETKCVDSARAALSEFESINLQTMETMKKTMKRTMRERVRDVRSITVIKALDGRRRQSTRAMRDELFRRWKTATEKSRRARVAVVRFILRADARRLGATFDSWRRYVHRAKVMWRKGTMIRRRSAVIANDGRLIVGSSAPRRRKRCIASRRERTVAVSRINRERPSKRFYWRGACTRNRIRR